MQVMQSPDKSDDASARRSSYAHNLQQMRSCLGDESLSALSIEEYSVLLIRYLHDPWSEIRKDTARSIKSMSISKNFSLMVLERLLEICREPATHSWQVLHGSILGLTCIGATLLRHSTDQKSAIETACMGLIGSDLLPVREAVRECLKSLQLVDHSLLHRISDEVIERCELDIAHLRETSASLLDGFLGVLADSLDLSADGSTDMTTRIEQSSIFAVDRSLLDALFLAMGHPSSIVRQRASQVYVSFCRRLIEVIEPHGVGVTRLVEVIESAESWRRLEACMLAAEELIRLAVEKDTRISCSLIYPLIDAIAPNLSRMLLHERYEIRRVAVQALPSVARVAVLSGLQSLLHASVPSSSSQNSLSSEAEIICNAVWVAELAKSSQLVFQSQASVQIAISDGARESDWVMNLPGRLSEEESKLAFREKLKRMNDQDIEKGVPSSLLQHHRYVQTALQPWLSYLREYLKSCISVYKVPVDILKTFAVLDMFMDNNTDLEKLENRHDLVRALILCQVVRKEPSLASIFSQSFHFLSTGGVTVTLVSTIENPQSYLEPLVFRLVDSESLQFAKLDLSSVDMWLCDNCAPIVICHVKSLYESHCSNTQDEYDISKVISFVILLQFWVKLILASPQCLEKRHAVRRSLYSSLPLVTLTVYPYYDTCLEKIKDNILSSILL